MGGDDIADMGIASGLANDADHLGHAGAGVIGHIES
jgi:hypothetical protein